MAQVIAAIQTSSAYVFFTILTLASIGLMILVWMVNASLIPPLMPHFAITVTSLVVTKLHYYQKDRN